MSRSFILKSLLLATVLFSYNSVHSAPVNFDATNGTWLISATDNVGLTWNGSTLVFESQVSNGDNFLLEGYFDWIGSNGSFGRENFTGTLFSDDTIQLSGFELVSPFSGIVTANYFAILSESGTELINGSWDDSGIPSNDWSATLQPVPIPTGIWLFASALFGFFGLLKKKPKISHSRR